MKLKHIVFVIALSFAVIACNKTSEKPAQETENQVSNDTPAETTTTENTNVDTNSTASGQTSVVTATENVSASAEVKSVVNKFTGYVVNLNNVVVGKNDKISSEKATNLLAKGQLLGFMANGNVYLVYNTDGTYASKKLSQIAGNDVTITGNLKVIDGTNYLIAEKFE